MVGKTQHSPTKEVDNTRVKKAAIWRGYGISAPASMGGMVAHTLKRETREVVGEFRSQERDSLRAGGGKKRPLKGGNI